MSNASETFLTGANIDFIEAQYERFLKDPGSVDPSWAQLFGATGRDGRPIITDGLDVKALFANGRPKNGAAAMGYAPVPPGPGLPSDIIGLQGKVDQTIISFRLRGHLQAQLDPLGVPRLALEHVADIGMVSRAHFTDNELDVLVDPQGLFDEARAPVRQVMSRLRHTYTRHIGVEYIQMMDSDRRRWLMRRMEHSENRTEYSLDEQRRILDKLAKAEAFETTIHTKFKYAKRFSIEGAESLIPMMDAFLELGGSLGIREVVIGMAHRGRLNVLTNVMGKSPDQIFSEFIGPEDPTRYLNRGDVKYHMGFSSDFTTLGGQKIHLTLAFNPSHLGVVHPVVEGRVRAKQDRAGEGGSHAIVPFVIHGDAAFSGQGLVAETLNLAELQSYSTGGTVHVVINNQLGYTTLADQGRTPLYCTAMAQMLDTPVFHVNGDDAEACVHVMRLATEYRQRFHADVVIDLVCYRKYGHNEGDEPAFTQPKMYELIRAHKTPREIYHQQLVASGRLTEAEAESIHATAVKAYAEAHTRATTKSQFTEPSHLLGVWSNYRGAADKDTPQVTTGLPLAELKKLLDVLATAPAGFTLHKGVQSVLDKRKKMVAGDEPIDWGAGEMLAYASLLAGGASLRLTGQDTERGTFAHRHAVLHDTKTGNRAFALAPFVSGNGRAMVINSPLSEMACLGFEFGYSLDYPDALVAWEAQFGDFANNAQVVIDQFMAAAEDKWRRLSGLTLLLPHGYEGAGPEHSSARLERYLELAAEDNVQVCYPTNSAQIFHLLRRQVLRPIRKPLVVMTPKSLLRLAEAAAPWSDFTSGGYKRIISETNPQVEAANVQRLLLCSGKVYFDLVKARDAAKDFSIAIVRVEQLYPLPEDGLKATLDAYPKLREVFWVQEEPKNSGAWRYMLEPLLHLTHNSATKPKVQYVGRVESASPATGYPKAHEYEQKLLVDEAIAKGK
ncbi:MAG: 2-oxoglutarate dehydrogenase E1 component [Myxococcaceae bacterium]|nr:2-oxoglutarate dehydrogenase E1 component [Myxococcaceae bacterium]